MLISGSIRYNFSNRERDLCLQLFCREAGGNGGRRQGIFLTANAIILLSLGVCWIACFFLGTDEKKSFAKKIQQCWKISVCKASESGQVM